LVLILQCRPLTNPVGPDDSNYKCYRSLSDLQVVKSRTGEVCPLDEEGRDDVCSEQESATDYESDSDPISKAGDISDSCHASIDLERSLSEFPNNPSEDNEKIACIRWKNQLQDKSQYVLPETSRWTNLVTWFTPYRQLFVLILGVNFLGASAALLGYWPWPMEHLTSLVVGNALLAISVRSEWVLRFLYWLAVKTFRPRIFPLWLRVKVVSILYHIGEHISLRQNNLPSRDTLLSSYGVKLDSIRLVWSECLPFSSDFIIC
jgi:hypothetical protein